MNETKMYRTQQFIKHDLQVELPKCMYRLTNIHSEGTGIVHQSSGPDHVASKDNKLGLFDQVKQFLKRKENTSGMTELEKRQTKILQQLKDLKDQMLRIKANLNIPNKSSPITGLIIQNVLNTCSTGKQQLLNLSSHPHLVIIVSSNYLPYSLHLLQKLLRNEIKLCFTSHLHSTLSCLPDKTIEFVKRLVEYKNDLNLPVLNINLIWKNAGPDMAMILTLSQIDSEVNILRYISRLSVNNNYEASVKPHEIDSILDISYRLGRSQTKTEITLFVQYINRSLGKADWLAGRNKISIADIAAYSVMKQAVKANELSVNLKKWLERCEQFE